MFSTQTHNTCFDENFEFSYPISNQTVVRSRFSSEDKKNAHKYSLMFFNSNTILISFVFLSDWSELYLLLLKKKQFS